MKVLNSGIKQLNFINMPTLCICRTYISRNVSDTLLHASPGLGSISKHFHQTNHSPGLVDQLKSTHAFNSLLPI